MTLEGAIKLNETNDYIIYTMNSVVTGQYGVVVPKNINGTLNMLVDLHMKGSFDGVGAGTKTREQLVSEISDEYDKVRAKYVTGMLVMPMLDESSYQNIVLNGDKQKMFDEVKKIGSITSELYKNLTNQGVDKSRIDQKIIILEKNDVDIKFVDWLKGQMPNFVEGVHYNELNPVQQQATSNPFVQSSDIFGTATVATESKVENSTATTSVNGGIFENVSSTSGTQVVPTVEPVSIPSTAPVTPVVENSANEVPSFNLFNDTTTSGSSQSVETSDANVVNQVPNVESPSVFGTTQTAGTPVQGPVVDGPKPVEGSVLEGTTTFAPIPEQQNDSTEVISEVSDEGNASKGSKGFVNLAILLVVLVGVTLVSIELGKYLYSVYGA